MIRRRTAFAILLSVLVSLPLPSWAQGNGNGQNNGNANGQNNGNGNSQDNGKANGHENGNNGNGNNGNGNNGQPNGNANEISGSLPDLPSSPGVATPAIAPPSSSAASQPAASPPGQNAPPLSQDDVLAAVESGRAVPLESLLADVRSRTGGEVIEANLQRVRGFLIYAVTVLTPAGRVSTEYYYARSGLHVGQP